MCHFDNYVTARLSSKYPQGPHSNLLFAAFTLPHSTPPSELFLVVTRGMNPSDERNFERADQNDELDLQFSNRNCYHSMLLAFLWILLDLVFVTLPNPDM